MKKSTPLSDRIKNYSLFTSAMLASSLVADAQVIYTDVDPDLSISDNYYSLDLNNDGITDFILIHDDFWGGTYSRTSVLITPKPGNAVVNYLNRPKVCDPGFVINTDSSWIGAGGYQPLCTSLHVGQGPIVNYPQGSWLEEDEKFLALQFLVDGLTYYGWARLSIPLDAHFFTIHDYAFQSNSGAPSIAGCVNGMTVFLDADHDGYGNVTNSVFTTDCVLPPGYVPDSTDCNDANYTVYPGAPEITVGTDDDCNGIIDADYWTQQTVNDGEGRPNAISFSIGSKGYFGTGGWYFYYDEEYTHKDFWEYDAVSDIWTQKADFAGGERTFAIGFAIGDKGYVGTGSSNYNNWYSSDDFWEYNPVNNSWTQKASFQGGGRGYAIGFSIGGKGYVGMGKNFSSYYKDFWEYDPSTDSWTQKSDFGGPERIGAAGFSIENKGYITTGSGYKDLWEFDPVHDNWKQLADFGGTGREGAVGFSIGGKGYVCTGRHNSDYLKDCWKYDTASDTWTEVNNFDGLSRYYGTGFSIGENGYFVSGYKNYGYGEVIYNDFWKYTPDCDGLIVYADEDSDGYGDAANSILPGGCLAPVGYVYNGTDCNDGDGAINPYAVDSCNGIDDNCDNIIDPLSVFYADADGDTYGDSTNTVVDCIAPADYVTNNTDCDDANSTIHPGATESCNNIDDNCDSNADEGVLITFYFDADSDGYGNPGVDTLACSSPPGYVHNHKDCNDSDGAIHPGAVETCNNLDEDCDAVVDDGLIFITYYADADIDNYGDISDTGNSLCNNPGPGYSNNNNDCDDTNASINPAIAETCNGLDDNCNLMADDGLIFITYYTDVDGDNYGDIFDAGNSLCNNPGTGYSTTNSDCDDTNVSINPAIAEICNGLDDNCNLVADEGLITEIYFADTDNDGFGNPNNAIDSCAQPIGFIADSTDCDDTNANVNPDATEILFNGIDDDCDGYLDEFGTAIYSSENTASAFSIFPNPTNGEFVVSLQLNNEWNAEAKIEVINLLGQVVHNKTSALLKGKLEEIINLNDEADGIYLVRVMVSDQVFWRQIVFED